MALMIYGKSTCHLCGQVLNEGDDIQQFPGGALFDPKSELDHLNDSSVHTECLAKRPEGFQALLILNRWLERHLD